MKKIKQSFILAVLVFCCFNNVRAQQNAKLFSVTAEVGPAIVVSVGAGVLTPSSATKDNAYLVNSPSINADVYFDVKRWVPLPHRPHIALGVNVGGTYNFGGGGGFGTTPNPFVVTGQTSSIVSDRGRDPADPGFRVGAGPQLNIGFGNHFIVSPKIDFGYMSLTHKEINVVQTTTYNGTNYDFNLTKLPENKISGFTVTPALRLQYMITPSIGFFAEGSYLLGPTVKTTTSSLVPTGIPQSPGNTYELQALQNGTYKTNETVSTKYNAMGISGGVVIGFGKKAKPLNDDKINPTGSTSGGSIGSTSNGLSTPTKRTSKDWDGTIEGLFEGQYASTIVSKNGGVQKIIDQINKQGKGKATLEKNKNIEYIKVVTQDGNMINSDFYPVSDFNKDAKTIGGGSGSGAGRCRSGGCFGCHPEGEFSTPTVYTHCLCSDEGTNPMCDLLSAISLDNYSTSSLDKDLILTLENDGTTLSNGSVKNINDLVITQFEHAIKIKTELKKEGSITYTETQFTAKGKEFIMIGRVGKDGLTNILIDKVLIFCNGTCKGSTAICKPYKYAMKYWRCDCNTGCKLEIIGFPHSADPIKNVGESMEGLLLGGF